MELELIKLEELHIDELTKIIKRAFDEDARIHFGRERGGPVSVRPSPNQFIL